MQQSSQSALLKHNFQVPRYTSYPTANHFSPTIGREDHTRWLSAIPENEPLSLYFHIPFCKKICWYCGCHTKASEKYEPVTHYLAYLKKEIGIVAAKLGEKFNVAHIHFGGGSPSYIEPDDFRDFMDHVRGLFSVLPDAEIAIEIDPRELNELKVAAYKKSGVNRVSLGVQDFHKDVQNAINRAQPAHLIYDAMKTFKEYGIYQINMDLLYGLPHQTSDSVMENVNIAAGMGAERISLFGYAHVPWMKKHMRLIDEAALPDGEARLAQFEAATISLADKGYVQIGLDHFVRQTDPMAIALRKKTLTRNFQGYSTDNASTLLGFGVSAISALPEGYLQNTVSNREYFAALDAGMLPTVRGIATSEDDCMRRRLIEHLMCYMAIDLDAFCKAEGQDPQMFAEAVSSLEPLQKDGLIQIDGFKITVSEDARQAVRLVCAAFDAYFKVSKKQHAQVA